MTISGYCQHWIQSIAIRSRDKIEAARCV